MHAVIFDIDGTLIDSCEADNALYEEAIREVLGGVHIRPAWHDYARVTDTGILADICGDNALPYDDHLSDRIRDVFVGKLSRHMAQHGPYVVIPGAMDYFSHLRGRHDMRIAYATGGWRASAAMKLSGAGFPLEGIPLATANDHPGREQIMLHALAQLQGPFESVTYFGDGAWDQKATANLGWSFVPVGAKLGGLLHFESLPANSPLHPSWVHA